MNETQYANAAEQVFENIAYQRGMKQLRDEVIKAWKECPVRDSEGQLLLLQLIKMTDKFEGMLKCMIEAHNMTQKLDFDELRNESKIKSVIRKIRR